MILGSNLSVKMVLGPKGFIPIPRIFFKLDVSSHMLNLPKKCPICRKPFSEHSELQDKICKVITIKEFAAYCPGFDVQYRPSFELQREHE